MKSPRHILAVALLIGSFYVTAPFAEALTISPVKVEVTGEPGQTLRGELELLNEQPERKVFFSSFENFEPSGDTGSPKFVGGSDGLATWLSTDTSVAVATGETVKVPYSITIPANAEAGGYFAAIFWGEQDPTAATAGEVSIGGKLGVLILLRVAGDIVEEAGITEFGTVGGNKVLTGTPVPFTYRFSNSGGDRVVPLGDVTITNTFGRETAVFSANATEGSVLPGSARRFQTSWGNAGATSTTGFLASVQAQLADFHLGLYTATLSVVYGATNQTATSDFMFVIIPWQLLVVIAGGLLIALFLLKRYNAWIISKSKSQA
jgi:hypothetical protein